MREKRAQQEQHINTLIKKNIEMEMELEESRFVC